MDLRKRTLAIVQWGSYRSFPVGGISTFVESIIPQLGDTFELKLIGMSMGEKIGRWTTINVSGKTYDFLPVVSSRPSNIFPDRVRLAYAMFTHSNAVRESRADAYYVHMTEAALGLMMAKRPVIVHVHGLYNLFRFSRFGLGGLFTKVYEKCYPHLFSRCTQVWGVGSKKEFDEFSRAMKVQSGLVLPNCVRENIFYPRDRVQARRELGIASDEIVLLYVGRLTETKNPRLLVEVGRLLRSDIARLKLVFVGDGPLREILQREAHGSENVVVTGALAPERVAKWMNAADALTVVSKTEAFTSIVALEALSCGCPVVATPVSALPDIIKPGVNGELSRDFTAEAYASAVRSVLRERPSAQSCSESVAGYTSAQVGAQIVSELQGVFPREISLPTMAV
jgi:glycosyltransferase involved in cell wall biosynthesis